MKILYGFLIIVVCSSCNKKDAFDLYFHSIQTTQSKNGQLEMQLFSTMNLNQQFYDTTKRGAYNNYFFSSLLNSDIMAFKNSEHEKYQIHGWDSSRILMPIRKVDSIYYYSFILDFTYSDVNKTIPKDTLVKVLKGKEFITGHVILIKDYFHEAYSNDINIPTSKILELYE